jgi:tetratricopeptide (TPR) repeat protein
MKSAPRYFRIRALATAVPAALALVLALALPVARAEIARTGSEPWYRQVSADARQRAQALFAQAIDKHQQLLRGDAQALYEQALVLWDNPDIQWNLALVLDDLGQYLRAYQEFERALRWGDALGPERLREVRDRMRVLETQRLARIETDREELAAVITLDGKPWPPRAGRRSTVVLPGEHYLAARKPGYFTVTRPVYVKAGQQARVALRMDEDRLIEVRRWKAWKPWGVIGAGVAVAAVAAGLEWQAFAHRDAAADSLARCNSLVCDSSSSDLYDRASVEHGLAIGAIAAGGAAIAAGLTLAWLNQPRAHRTEARSPSRIELTPILSQHQAEISALVRF